MHMLLASDFILNGGLSPSRPFAISPWLTETRNIVGSLDPARHIYIPDVNPVEMLVSSNENGTQPDFSMAAGDFVSIYSHRKEHEAWDWYVIFILFSLLPSNFCFFTKCRTVSNSFWCIYICTYVRMCTQHSIFHNTLF